MEFEAPCIQFALDAGNAVNLECEMLTIPIRLLGGDCKPSHTLFTRKKVGMAAVLRFPGPRTERTKLPADLGGFEVEIFIKRFPVKHFLVGLSDCCPKCGSCAVTFVWQKPLRRHLFQCSTCFTRRFLELFV